MRKLIAMGVVVLGGASASMAAPYTNVWNNTAGVSVWKNYGDAANWKVTYSPTTEAPASAVPTKVSLTKMLQSASVTLQDGDDYTLGETYFLGCGTRWKTLNLKIPSGARLSLDGTTKTSWMGTSSYVEAGVCNYTTFDIDGGALTLGQKYFNMCGNTQARWTEAPVNHILVHNGGTLAITNGCLRLWGGSSGDSQGRGLYTNIIDVLSGSTLAISKAGRLVLASGMRMDAPWGDQSYYGSGWVNIKGGQLTVASGLTHEDPIVMGGHENGEMGGHLNVSGGGIVNLGTQNLFLYPCNTNIIAVTGGGVITNGSLSLQRGNSTSAKYHNLIDVNNGTAYINTFRFGDRTGENNARATVRVHGTDSKFSMAGWNIYSSYYSQKISPVFFDLRLKAHTPYTADFAVNPITTRTAAWSCHINKQAVGTYRVSPDGGFQLLHKDWVELLARSHDGERDYGAKDGYWTPLYGGVIGEEMWQTNCNTYCEARWERYVGYKYAYTFRVKLKDAAKLTDGEVLAEGKPRAWLQLPKFTAKQLNTQRTERISVRLCLAAPEGGTLDLDRIVSNLRTEGDQEAFADSSVAPYNVRIDLPIGELRADTTEDKAVMDFVSCETYGQAAGAQPMVTNALIRAATCEVSKWHRGLILTTH